MFRSVSFFKKAIFEGRTNFCIMLSIFFIYFLGKSFYTLAEKHNQHKWLYAILGILSYYVATIVFIVILVVLDLFLSLGVDGFSERALGFIAIPFGLLGCWGFYRLLENKWKKIIKVEVETIDEIGKHQNPE